MMMAVYKAGAAAFAVAFTLRFFVMVQKKEPQQQKLTNKYYKRHANNAYDSIVIINQNPIDMYCNFCSSIPKELVL